MRSSSVSPDTASSGSISQRSSLDHACMIVHVPCRQRTKHIFKISFPVLFCYSAIPLFCIPRYTTSLDPLGYLANASWLQNTVQISQIVRLNCSQTSLHEAVQQWPLQDHFVYSGDTSYYFLSVLVFTKASNQCGVHGIGCYHSFTLTNTCRRMQLLQLHH